MLNHCTGCVHDILRSLRSGSNDQSAVSLGQTLHHEQNLTDNRIVFRAFQGIGGSGMLSLTFVILPEMVEPAQYSRYAAFNALAYAVSYLLGPLVGGAICDNTTWRWVFLLKYVY